MKWYWRYWNDSNIDDNDQLNEDGRILMILLRNDKPIINDNIIISSNDQPNVKEILMTVW